MMLAAMLTRRDAAVPGVIRSSNASGCDLEGLDIAGQQALLSIQVTTTSLLNHMCRLCPFLTSFLRVTLDLVPMIRCQSTFIRMIVARHLALQELGHIERCQSSAAAGGLANGSKSGPGSGECRVMGADYRPPGTPFDHAYRLARGHVRVPGCSPGCSLALGAHSCSAHSLQRFAESSV